MKVLQIHNAYREVGGEDSVVAAEALLLRDHGNEVRLYGADNVSIGGILSKAATAWHLSYSVNVREKLRQDMTNWRPDVVHVHNFFPLLTPAVFDACLAAGVPAIMTLHNFRLLCPGALLWRKGQPCEACVGRTPWRAAWHRCYRKSLIGSIAVSRMVDFHRRNRTWQQKVDHFIAVSDFARSKFIAAGWDEKRITVKPHFKNNPQPPLSSCKREGALFVGRLSPEKGVATILAAWESIPFSLRLVGEGALKSLVEKHVSAKIFQLGWLEGDELSSEMKRAACLVVASECYETFGMVVIEAFAHGLPVVASRIGALPELVEDGVTGFLFEPGNAQDLSSKVRKLLDKPEEALRMGKNARAVFEDKYTPEKNYPQLLQIYQDAIHGKKANSWT